MTKREQVMALVDAARSLQRRLDAAMQADYPHLWGWRIPLELESDMTLRQQSEKARSYMARAVRVASSRISEAYGLGAGSEWSQKHFECAGDEARAECQVLTSAAKVLA